MEERISRKLGFLGPKGTHSEAVANHLLSTYPEKFQSAIPYDTIYETINAVANDEIEYCVVPIENSIEGSINITLDTLVHEVNLKINHELIWAVHNQLLVKDQKTEIKYIVSHPQPLAQCHNFLQKNYPLAKIIPVDSTAKAAEIVAGGAENYAAIATNVAAKLYNLEIKASDIEDMNTNCTRFVVLHKDKQEVLGDKVATAIVCQLKGDNAGALCEILQEFAKRNVNLTKIESRPARTGLGEYIFFLNIEGSVLTENIKETLTAVAEKCLWVKNLGSFNVEKIDNKIKKVVI